ncbi:Ppx/GppA family phosphatase [Tropicimonas sp. S265A]|uniref:Ppx/GppA family phosphatase n=1 Tax=Tropicimonas sp. S265A TaxID=3415134 RepID=UPI003C7ADB5D
MKDEDWGPFGRPLFEDPSARALRRVGVIDVGSNSVRMVVFDGAARSPAYFYNEKVMAGLGAGLSQTGHLNPEGRVRAMAAIKRFVLIAKSMEVTPLVAVATAAMREAEDGPAFREEVTQETGLRLWVIDGTEEARLSAQGVLLGRPEAEGLICDIGGASMELAEVGKGRVGRRATSALGPLKLRDIEGGKKALKSHIADQLEALKDAVPPGADRLFLVGGSWRAIARLDMIRRDYPLTVLHEYRIAPNSLSDTLDFINAHEVEDLRTLSGIGEARMSLVPMAAHVLRHLVDAYAPAEIIVSSYGIREGLLYEQMPEKLRKRDPLIEACRHAEAQSARIPGFGRSLFSFISPLFEGEDWSRLRLVKAACLLHDISWRAHPDYRAEVCFDTATRANLGGLDHSERVFLGLALLHRYKNSRSGSRFEPYLGLLSEDEQNRAETLGKAMRFGAMLAAQDSAKMGALRYDKDAARLELRLLPETSALFGEVADARFKSLARALNADPVVLGA